MSGWPGEARYAERITYIVTSEVCEDWWSARAFIQKGWNTDQCEYLVDAAFGGCIVMVWGPGDSDS